MTFLRATSLLISAVLLAPAAWAAADDGAPPQMDQSWYANQLFWLAVSFLLMYLLVSKFIAPSVSGVLATRENAITEAIAEAERAKALAESTRGSSNSESRSARTRAAEIMANAQAANSKAAAEAIARLDHELVRKANHAEAVLVDAVAKAQNSVEKAAQELAEAMTASLLGKQENVDEHAPKLKRAVKR